MTEFVYDTSKITAAAVTPPKYTPYEIKNIFSHTHKFDFNKDDPIEIASRLIETAKTYKSYSCCANQIGLDYSVFVAGYDNEFVAFFNPRIIDFSLDETLGKESDNITFPGLILNIYRSNNITVEYQDFEGNLLKHQFDGLTARVIQQCVQRLDGHTIDQNVSKLQFERANKALSKKVKAVVRYQMNQLRVKK